MKNTENKTRVISGFPGVGKSYAIKLNDPYNGLYVQDSDSSKFPKGNFPQNYLEHIYYSYNVSQPTMLFVSSHEEVREGLVDLGIPFDLVFPDKSLLGEYIQRYTNRGNVKAFIDVVYTNWDAWIESCEKQDGCNKIILKSGQFLIDIL